MFRKILVPIDGSGPAAHALAEAVDLARSTDAGLTVMTVVPDPAAWVGGGWGGYIAAVDLVGLERQVEDEHRALLDQAVDALPAGLSAAKVLRHGHAGEAIVEAVRGGGHDLVVMGSRGRGAVGSMLLGSVSHHVLHACTAAVLIVHDDASPPSRGA